MQLYTATTTFITENSCTSTSLPLEVDDHSASKRAHMATPVTIPVGGIDLRTRVLSSGKWKFEHCSNAIGTISWRDRGASLYSNMFTHRTNFFVLATSIALVVLSFFSPQSVSTVWYQLAEGSVLVLFLAEVGLRFLIMRSSFWESSFNIIEAVTCILCAIIYSFLQFCHFAPGVAVKQEHWVLMLLRYTGQILRVIGVVAMDTVKSRDARGEGIQVFSAGCGSAPSSLPLGMSRFRRDSLEVI